MYIGARAHRRENRNPGEEQDVRGGNLGAKVWEPAAMRRGERQLYWEPDGDGEFVFSRAGRTILSESVRPTINDVEEDGGGSATAGSQEEDGFARMMKEFNQDEEERERQATKKEENQPGGRGGKQGGRTQNPR